MNNQVGGLRSLIAYEEPKVYYRKPYDQPNNSLGFSLQQLLLIFIGSVVVLYILSLKFEVLKRNSFFSDPEVNSSEINLFTFLSILLVLGFIGANSFVFYKLFIEKDETDSTKDPSKKKRRRYNFFESTYLMKFFNQFSALLFLLLYNVLKVSFGLPIDRYI